jgi:glycosyltransferase involved in cell wall biosynthesis
MQSVIGSLKKQHTGQAHVIVLFSTLPLVGGNSTITLRLALKFREEGNRVVIVAKEMPSIGYCENTLSSLLKAGCVIHKWPLNRPLAICGLLFKLHQEAKRGPVTFVAVGMRWGAILLTALVRFDTTWFYMIQHDKLLGPIRIFGPLIRIFEGIGMISTESIGPARKKLDGGPHIVWLPQFSGTAKSKYCQPVNMPEGKRSALGFLGQLTDSKGILLLIKLWSENRSLPKLIVVGDGPLRAAIETAARGDDRIDYRGGFTASEAENVLPRFFSEIDTLLVPIIREGDGIPTVILEGLSYGVPTLCTNLGGLGAFDRALKPLIPGVVRAVSLENFKKELESLDTCGADHSSLSVHCRSYYDSFFSDQTVLSRWNNLLAPINPVI